MKTLYLTRGNNILIDTEENTADRLTSAPQRIDYVYLAKEPMHVIFGEGDNKKEFDVKKGELIVTFYEKDFKNRAIVVKNKQWADNITTYEKLEQERKEKWAAESTCKNCNDCISGESE